jgi:pantoate--beta-alanine ligase
MRVLKTKAEVRAARPRFKEMGLVPTMGFLHEGHLSLMRRAKGECGAVTASIFVNPTQFAPGGDFDKYPRDMDRDLTLLQEAGVDLVFTPSPEEIYPEGFAASVIVGGVSEGLEGASRPGHFAGVATVVLKLINIVQPTRAYFGQKDAQQAAVIQKLAHDLDLPAQIVIAPTVREADGLAMSSRNSYLAPNERAAAVVLHRALTAAESLFNDGERSAAALRAAMTAVLAGEPLAEVDYVSIADPLTLKEISKIKTGALVSMAVKIGSARLIDNLVFG